MRSKLLGWIAAGLVAAPLAAEGALITGNLRFTASGFGAGAPVDPVTGTVTYRFDNAATFLNRPVGAVVNGTVVDATVSGLNLPGSWVPVVTYFLNAQTPTGDPVVDVLAIGHTPTTVVNAGTNDWRFAVTNVSTNPVFREFVYATTANTTTTFLTNTGSVTPIPEPGTLTLLGLGAAVVGLRRRGRAR